MVLSPSEVFTNDTVTATVTTEDAEGDSVAVDYAWYVDGSLVAETSNSLDGATYFDKGQEVYVVVTPDDGWESGSKRDVGFPHGVQYTAHCTRIGL